jgi:hypothetical protein
MYHQPIDFQHDWDLRTHKYSFRSNYLYTITNATVVEGAHSFIVIAGKDNSRLYFFCAGWLPLKLMSVERKSSIHTMVNEVCSHCQRRINIHILATKKTIDWVMGRDILVYDGCHSFDVHANYIVSWSRQFAS